MIQRKQLLRIMNVLINNLMLLGDYDNTLGLRRRVLLVEGITDERFIEPIKDPEVRCKAVSNYINSQAPFSTSTKSDRVSSKAVIVEIVKALHGIPIYLELPAQAKEWPIYGLVDNDFQTDASFMHFPKLLFTGTHDIETFMLSTDVNLLTRLEGCAISDEDARKAFYLAYQLAYYRRAIRASNFFETPQFTEVDGTIQFSFFTEGIIISLPRLLEYTQSKTDGKVSKARVTKYVPKIQATSIMKKKLKKDGSWKEPFDQFSIALEDDFWIEVNGHDIGSAIRYINSSAREFFGSSHGYRQNKSFELALSKAYDYSTGRSTRLFEQLLSAKLINVV